MSKKWKLAQYLELRWWKFYLRKKHPVEYLNWKKNYWTQFLKKLELTIDHQKTYLDAGCGPAGIFTILHGKKVDALDPLLDAYEQLEHFKKKNYPNINFMNGSLELFDQEKKYDVIFCINAINHVKDIEMSMTSLKNCLLKNSKLIISSDFHKSNLLKSIFRMLPGDLLHPIQFDQKDFEEIFLKLDLKIEKKIIQKQNLFFNYGIFILTI